MTARDVRALAALVVILLLGGVILTKLPPPPLADFVEYWASAKILLDGGNPWDEERIGELERSVDRSEDPVLMWNPPWALTLVLPLGFLPSRPAHLLWVVANALALVGATYLLIRIYARAGQERIVWLGACALMPCYSALAQGQIAPLMPLALALFLLAVRSGHDFLAGLACALVSIKPQVGLLFWASLGLWLLWTRRGRVVVGLVVGIAAGMILPLLLNPQILTQYQEAVARPTLHKYASPTWGTFLRLALGQEHFRLQFISPVVGLIWVVAYWMMRKDWEWTERLPLVFAVSVVTMTYGWFYDLVVLLLAIAQVAGKSTPPRWAVLTYLAINAFALAQVVYGAHGMWFVWAAPAFLVLYLLVHRGEGDAGR